MRFTYEQLVEAIRGTVEDGAKIASLLPSIREAAKQLNLDDSQSGIYSKIQRALTAQFQADGTTNIWPWIRDIFGDGTSGILVYSADLKLYSATYKIAGDTVTLGTPSRVMLAYVPAKSPVKEALVLSVPENDAIEESVDTDLSTELVPIREAALSAEGKGLLKLIAAGQGSSRFYPKATLQKAAEAKVFHKGMHMHMDHQTAAQEKERPEGSVATLMGALDGDAEYQEAGPDGPGLYAPVHVYSDFVPFINERHKDIGNSIRAMGRSKKGQVAGVNTEIVEELVAAKSVDFVTMPGAGGKLVPLSESYREFKVSTSRTQEAATSRNPIEQEQSMTAEEKAQLQALQESVTNLTTNLTSVQQENASLRESAVRSSARVLVTRKLAAADCNLPAKAKQRIETFFESAALPKTANGELDTAGLEANIDTQIKSESDYLKECSATGVKGLGESRQEPSTTIKPEDAQKMFTESVGFIAGVPQKEAK